MITDNGSCHHSGLWHRARTTTETTVLKTRPRRPLTNGKVCFIASCSRSGLISVLGPRKRSALLATSASLTSTMNIDPTARLTRQHQSGSSGITSPAYSPGRQSLGLRAWQLRVSASQPRSAARLEHPCHPRRRVSTRRRTDLDEDDCRADDERGVRSTDALRASADDAQRDRTGTISVRRRATRNRASAVPQPARHREAPLVERDSRHSRAQRAELG